MENCFKLTFSTIMLLFALVGCQKDEDFTSSQDNHLSYDGKIFNLSKGDIYYWGDEYESGAFVFHVNLHYGEDFPNQDIDICFNFFSSSSSELVAGEYTLVKGSYQPNTFSYGDFYLKEGSYKVDGEISSGTVDIKTKDSIYEFSIDCITSDGNRITGYYHGILTYYNETSKK